MFPTFLKLFLTLVFWGIFTYVLFYIPYPKSLTQASFFQLVLFFIPLLLALIFTINLIFKNFFSSLTLSTGAILLLILKSLDALNLVTASLTILAVYLFLSYFQKSKKRLTSGQKIPKLTHMRKQ